MMPEVRPLLELAAARPETPDGAKSVLKSLIDRRPQEPAATPMPRGAFRILRDPESGLSALDAELDLGVDQQAKVREALDRASVKLATAIEQFRSGARNEANAGIAELYREFHGAMEKVLTADQLAALDELVSGGRRPRKE